MSPTRYLLPRQQACSSKQLTGFRAGGRFYNSYGDPTPKSRHSSLYSDTLPAMVPIFLLGSAVFLGLQLLQSKLSHEKIMDESTERVRVLEAEIDALQQKRATSTPITPERDISERKETVRRRWW